MNIAVVGGGSRCKRLIELIQRHAFQEIDPKVVAVADLNENAPGYVKAKNNGLFVTHDYNDFFNRDDIDLIIELTGNMDIYNDILSKKKTDCACHSQLDGPAFLGSLPHIHPAEKDRSKAKGNPR